MNARQACATQRITQTTLDALLAAKAEKLARCGLEDLNLKPDHLLISFDDRQRLVVDPAGVPEVRLCNFELVRRFASCSS